MDEGFAGRLGEGSSERRCRDARKGGTGCLETSSGALLEIIMVGAGAGGLGCQEIAVPGAVDSEIADLGGRLQVGTDEGCTCFAAYLGQVID